MAYCDRGDIEDIYGIGNVQAWADLDNNQDPDTIANRITKAISRTSAFLDSVLASTDYVVPVVLGDGATVPELLIELCASFAGVWLYQARGVTDFNPESGQAVHKLVWNKKEANELLANILSGSVQLIGAQKTTAANASESSPVVVRDRHRHHHRHCGGSANAESRDFIEALMQWPTTYDCNGTGVQF